MDIGYNQKQFSALKVISIFFLAPIISFTFLDNHQAVASIFLLTILLWLTEAIPLPATALLVPVLSALSGLVAPAEAFAPFGSDILYLFLGCFLISLSMEKYGFDKRVAYWLLSRCLPGESLFAVNFVIAASCFILSMWISNTVACAILCTVTVGIIGTLERRLSSNDLIQRVNARFLLSCAFASSIGGLATPIGSPPNLIALKFLNELGISLSFLEWVRISLPVSVIMFVVMLLVFEYRYPVRGIRLENIRAEFLQSFKNLGAWSAGEKQIAAIFFGSILFWVSPGILLAIFPESDWIKALSSRLSITIVGLSGGLATFFLPVCRDGKISSNLDWTISRRIDWGTILLFGGGLSLGNLLVETGAANAFGEFVFKTGGASIPVLLLTVVVVAIVFSNFASNTAAAAILIPLVIGAIRPIAPDQEVTTLLVLSVAFSASLAFMLPISTLPNAIVYGTGKVSTRDMLMTGVVLSVLATLVIYGFISFMMF